MGQRHGRQKLKAVRKNGKDNVHQYNMAKTITWKDNDDRTCVLTIADGQSAVTTLTLGEEPFVTSIDDTDDLFQTIRTSSGNIGVSIRQRG